MKLKYITLISFVVFVGSITALAFLPVNTFNKSLSNQTQTENLNINNSLVNTDPSQPSVVLTLEEIKKHSTKEDCYLTIKGAVYSVSSFIDQHPGGVKKITDMCGGEATAVFSAIHSNFAWNLLKDYYIGNVGQSINTQSIDNLNIQNTNKPNLNLKQEDDDREDEDENEYEKD